MNSFNLLNVESETTGKYLVLFRENQVDAGIDSLSDLAGVTSLARAADFEDSAVSGEQLNNTDTVLDNLGVAIVTLDPEQLRSLNRASASISPVVAIEQERVVHVLGNKGLGELESLMSAKATWGLQTTKVIHSPFSGRGIKVAVLDTGLDLTHPDFVGRTIVSKSFIDNEDVLDRHGHGTHCIGTACGSQTPPPPPRYGIAYNAEIYAGKVLNNQGKGTDGSILAGIQWAVANGCHVVSMSLGAPTFLGERYSKVFEIAARRALQNGTLIIAAAGNESDRTLDIYNPIAHPANCPSIMSVAALDSQLQIAYFCNRGCHPQAKQIDIAAPGVDIHSTWPMATKYKTISGTSMATPHVAGIAALYAEATGATGKDLWKLLIEKARRLPLATVDVGYGLVQVITDTSDTLDTETV